MIEKLFRLKIGNRVDHEATRDIRPEEKPVIVHDTYNLARFLVEEIEVLGIALTVLGADLLALSTAPQVLGVATRFVICPQH